MKTILYKSLVILFAANFSMLCATTPVSGVSGGLTVRNCVIYNDSVYSQTGAATTVVNSAIRGLSVNVNGNVKLSSLSFADALAAPHQAMSYYLSPVSLLTDKGVNVVGSQSVDINGNVRSYNNKTDIGAVEYSLIHSNGDSIWNHSLGWNIGRIPYNKDLVTIKTRTIVNSTDAVCRAVIHIDSTVLAINSASVLVVDSVVNNSNSGAVLVRAQSGALNGTLIFHNPQSNPLAATVQYYSQGSYQASSVANSKYSWQYFGIPLRNVAALPAFKGSWVRMWDETSTKYSKWNQLSDNSVLASFKGYEVTQVSPKTISLSGVLENKDTTIQLSKSDVPYYAGQHVLSNPYTAGLSIDKIQFGNNVEKTVYVYNTGTYNDWNLNPNVYKTGSSAGQYIAIPQNLTPMFQRDIPSMQGFVVRATGANASITIPYSGVCANSSLQRVATGASVMPYMKIMLSSDTESDVMWLVRHDGASRNFDNGWDGKKIEDQTAAQLFSCELDGNFQVDVADTLNNMSIAVKAGSSGRYTLRLVNNELSVVGLYLLDIQTNQLYRVNADTTDVAFEATNSKPEIRFRLLYANTTGITEIEHKLSVLNSFGTLVISNPDCAAGNYSLYDLSGRCVMSGVLQTSRYTSVCASGCNGIYILKIQTNKEIYSQKFNITSDPNR